MAPDKGYLLLHPSNSPNLLFLTSHYPKCSSKNKEANPNTSTLPHNPSISFPSILHISEMVENITKRNTNRQLTSRNPPSSRTENTEKAHFSRWLALLPIYRLPIAVCCTRIFIYWNATRSRQMCGLGDLNRPVPLGSASVMRENLNLPPRRIPLRL